MSVPVDALAAVDLLLGAEKAVVAIVTVAAVGWRNAPAWTASGGSAARSPAARSPAAGSPAAGSSATSGFAARRRASATRQHRSRRAAPCQGYDCQQRTRESSHVFPVSLWGLAAASIRDDLSFSIRKDLSVTRDL